MAFTRITTLALVAGMAVAASGCSIIGDQIEEAVGDGIEEAVEGVIEDQTGTDIEIGSDVDLPSEFPGELPLPEGTLNASLGTEDGFWLQYSVSGEDAATDLVAAYEGDGFTVDGEQDITGIQTWALSSDDYSVAIGLIGEEGTVDYQLTVTVNPKESE